jgi:hypothetical protein
VPAAAQHAIDRAPCDGQAPSSMTFRRAATAPAAREDAGDAAR